jgi:hypothetical protein
MRDDWVEPGERLLEKLIWQEPGPAAYLVRVTGWIWMYAVWPLS